MTEIDKGNTEASLEYGSTLRPYTDVEIKKIMESFLGDTAKAKIMTVGQGDSQTWFICTGISETSKQE